MWLVNECRAGFFQDEWHMKITLFKKRIDINNMKKDNGCIGRSLLMA